MQSFIQFQKMVQEIQIKQAKGDILTFLLTYLLKYILTKGSRKKSYFLVDRPLRKNNFFYTYLYILAQKLRRIFFLSKYVSGYFETKKKK